MVLSVPVFHLNLNSFPGVFKVGNRREQSYGDGEIRQINEGDNNDRHEKSFHLCFPDEVPGQPATCTPFRPDSLTLYMASSAAEISSLEQSASSGNEETPKLPVTVRGAPSRLKNECS